MKVLTTAINMCPPTPVITNMIVIKMLPKNRVLNLYVNINSYFNNKKIKNNFYLLKYGLQWQTLNIFISNKWAPNSKNSLVLNGLFQRFPLHCCHAWQSTNTKTKHINLRLVYWIISSKNLPQTLTEPSSEADKHSCPQFLRMTLWI